MLLNDTNGSNNKEMKRDADENIWQNIYFDGIGMLIVQSDFSVWQVLTRATENIVVTVEGEKGLNQSLLVVAHFDSSTLSPGTSIVAALMFVGANSALLQRLLMTQQEWRCWLNSCII